MIDWHAALTVPRRAAALLALGLLTAVSSMAARPAMIRPAAVAGQLYPEAAGELRKTVRQELDGARPEVPEDLAERRPLALIVPHGGYPYSASTAAHAYRLLRDHPRPDRIILLGPSHHTRLLGACSVSRFGHYETPLGRVSVDRGAADTLVESEPFHSMRFPHIREHSLEVQLPFLQVIWPDPPPVVPVLVGSIDPAQTRAAAAAVGEIVTEGTLIVVSTDFTRCGGGFEPFPGSPPEERLENIRELDMLGAGHVSSLDPDGWSRYLAERNPSICGGRAVQMLLLMLRPADGARVLPLHWQNSARLTGSTDNCVSYLSMAAYADPAPVGRHR